MTKKFASKVGKTSTEGQEWWNTPHHIKIQEKMDLMGMSLIKSISEEEVKRMKRQLGNHKAEGTDNIPAELLKWTGDKVNSCIAKLFNNVLQSQEIPQSWHESLLCPIFKRGKRDDLKNYRPISITISMYKLFMKILTERLSVIVTETELLHQKQSAFQKEHSTAERIIEVNEVIKDAKANKKFQKILG